MKKTLTFIGSFRSVSKANNPFAIGYFTGAPDDRIRDKCVGVVGYKFFVSSDLLTTLSALNVGSKVEADLFSTKNEKGEYITHLVGLNPIK